MKMIARSCFLLFAVASFLPCRAATISLINHTNVWRYRKGTSAPQSNWKSAAEGSLDGSWLSGAGGIGYADNTTETTDCRTLLTDMHNAYTTVAMRRIFQVTSNIDSTLHLALTMDWDDGFIAWLDGIYVAHSLSPGAPAEPAFNAVATDLHESSHGSSGQPARTFDLGAIGSRLPIGTHVLAIVGLNESSSSSDFIQIADLAAVTPAAGGVSGLIAEDTTWRRVDSPIIVAGDVTVNFGATLTIEPGVRVLFQPGFILTVNGILVAEGDPTNRIVFSRAPGNTGTWGGISVNGLQESRIRYAHVEFNSGNAISVAGGTVWLDHMTFGTPLHTYVDLSGGSSFVISDCEFPNSAAKFEFIHSVDIRTNGHGIIRGNFFGLTTGYSDVIDHSGSKRPNGILHVINNVFSGASDDGLDIDGTDAWVEGNIFQHVHRRGDTPDSSGAVSGGNRNGLTSAITVIGNIFFDCDNAATCKQGNFYTFINNTVVHITNAGGIDGDSGVFCMRDTTPSVTTYGSGLYAEGNIIADVSQLVRQYDAAQTTVTLNGNILPVAWAGPGATNIVGSPLLKHIPTMAETVFTNWTGAQIYRQWFELQAGSPGLGSGPNGRNKGGVIPIGASISGAPLGATYRTNASLFAGVVRTGFGIPASAWPSGSGYTHYKFRVDGGAWSTERTMNIAMALRLGYGPHHVDVVGKRDSGLYQDDSLFGSDAVITSTRIWVIEQLRITSASIMGRDMHLEFPGHAGESYTVQYRDGLDPAHAWTILTNVPLQTEAGIQLITDANANTAGTPTRFYRVRTP
ncbi:MAG TPA: hypothetical protein VJ063_05420 [Verrucomicrobiae bacterium]|nr:hypothetical protein [Verrucomicrobiae bacterium]